MSKSIIIQEAGEPKTLSSIDKIITPKVGGGSAEWVLFENLDLMAKTVTKNGTYKAEDDNVYGYHKVTVKVPKKGKKKTGKRPQSSGDPNDYCVTTEDDGQGGQNLVYTKLPTSISIINPPNKTVYDDNELIKKDGMLVKAYFADGGLWGDVPLGEIRLDPDRANASQASGNIYRKNGVTALGISCTIPVTPDLYWRNYRTSYPIGYSERGAFGAHFIFLSTITSEEIVFITKYNDIYYAANSLGNTSSQVIAEENGEYDQGGAYFGGVAGEPYVFGTAWADSNVVRYLQIPTSSVDPTTVDFSGAKASEQDITVKWNRPEDEKTLTDKFTITVREPQGE